MLTVGRFLSLAVAAALFFAVPAVAHAQNGRIRGTVRDASGDALAGVTIRAQGTAAPHRATTASDGSYTVSNLTPGTYVVSASLPGLRTQSQANVRVSADAETVVDFVMQALQLEAVTVTAMLREQRLADVPFSIAAPTEQALRVRGADNIEAVAANVAGFSVQNLGPGQSQVAMRGASSGQIARDQPGVKEQVGAYFDESPVSLSLFTPDVDLFDVSRVEVLRGPQGTLFGAGSLAGTVRYISNQPELGVSSTFGEVGGHWVDGGGPGSTAKIGVNAPLGQHAAARIVGYSNRTGGWMDAVQPDFTVNRDVNGSDKAGLRAAVRLQPNERFSITPRIFVQRVRADGWNRIDAFNILANPYTTSRRPVTLGNRQLFTQINEPYTDDFLLGDVNWQYKFGGATLTSITSYTHRNILVVRDATALTASVMGGTLGLSDRVYTLDSPLNDTTRSKVWTQELRLTGASRKLRWLVGGFYAKSKRDYGQNVRPVGVDSLAAAEGFAPRGWSRGNLGAGIDVLFFSKLHYDLKQYAAFGEATLSATDRVDLTAGLRYYNFNENRSLIFDGAFAVPTDTTGTTDASGVAPRFIVSYKASNALTLNAQASRGFRLGGINDPLNAPLCSAADLSTFGPLAGSWKDETAWNYEVGAKSQFSGGRGSLNVSAFYMDIRDLQLTVTAGSCSSRLILNADKARSVGAEFELTASPNDHVDLSVSAGLNNSKLLTTFKDQGGNVVAGIAEGNRLPSVPRFQGSAALTYGWNMGTGSRAFVSGTYHYVGSRYTLIDDQGNGVGPACAGQKFGCVDLNTFGSHTIGGPLTQGIFRFDPLLPAYNLVNLRVGLTRQTWELSVYLNNALDEIAFLALDRERGTRARVGYLTNQPRTVGVAMRFDY
ncbi:MAG: TonB-dependent receptor [Gemmatimonadetes bacterium]|nr:MAG: TonB-dependent receptor [Gemmatimonadota bacterium]